MRLELTSKGWFDSLANHYTTCGLSNTSINYFVSPLLYQPLILWEMILRLDAGRGKFEWKKSSCICRNSTPFNPPNMSSGRGKPDRTSYQSRHRIRFSDIEENICFSLKVSTWSFYYVFFLLFSLPTKDKDPILPKLLGSRTDGLMFFPESFNAKWTETIGIWTAW